MAVIFFAEKKILWDGYSIKGKEERGWKPMIKKIKPQIVLIVLIIILTGCEKIQENTNQTEISVSGEKGYENGKESVINATDKGEENSVTKDTTVRELINNPYFGNFGHLLFPVDRTVSEDMTLADISTNNVYVWYSNIQVSKTVEIVNNLLTRAENGEQIFYRIYSDEEIAEDSSKADTGLFYFKGVSGEKFAIINAGGGFMYVGAMHDSFPHALEISKKGYNAFALIYRPNYAYEDLAQAIRYIYDHVEELEVNTQGYSLWGGSAGARTAAVLGNADYARSLGLADIPQASAVIMQYTGYSEVSEKDAPTYACVGTNDSIANWKTMQNRLNQLEKLGIPTEFHSYEGLSHGFGLGTGTVADGWIDDAVVFWEKQN